MPRSVVVDETLTIRGRELRVSHARSAGPGGQNVNKVNSKAIVRWTVGESTSLPEDVRRRFLTKYANRINAEGELVLSSDEHREQSRNLSACLDRLAKLVAAVVKPPRRRVKTKPTRAAVKRRIENKQQASQTKQRRNFRGEAE